MGLLIVVAPLALTGAGYFVAASRMARECRIDDLPFVLRRTNLEQLEQLLNPAVEAELRRTMSAHAFRKTQAHRLRSAREQAGRLSHNASALQSWANYEYGKIRHKNPAEFDAGDDAVVKVIRIASRVKKMTVLMKVKITAWQFMLHLPLIPSPNLAELRELMGADVLDIYQALSSAAGQLGLAQGRERYEHLLAAL
jgi:hypothetical protein